MKFYKTTTEYNCGIDLHSRQMYMCLMDKEGNILVHRNIKGNNFDYFLKLIEPYRHSLTVCCECTFNWYWLADACLDAGLEFVLGHALYMKAIHDFKTKNDKRDSMQIAHLLRRTSKLTLCRVSVRFISLLERFVRHVGRQGRQSGGA